jgi:hypothetical protein
MSAAVPQLGRGSASGRKLMRPGMAATGVSVRRFEGTGS